MSTDLIPDSITPVEGWKTFSLVKGELLSPNFDMRWPKQKPTEAQCGINVTEYRWVIASRDPAEESIEKLAQSEPAQITYGGTWTAAFASTVTVTFQPEIPEKPKVLPPPGKYWALELEVVSHSAPGEECNCGIHIAKDHRTAIGYGEVLAKVKGWGNVVEHTDGWRAEYAYPSHLYAATMEEALLLADYGVPVTLIEDIEDEAVKLSAMAARPELFPSPPKALQVFVAAAPLILALLAIGQAVNVAFNPSIIGLVAFGIAAFATGVLITGSVLQR